ncbi:NEW3 domain-containing protein, partial [Candidatus Bipolaricaulota bacterium]
MQKAALIAASLVVLLGFSGWSVEISVLSTPKDGSPGSFVTHVFGIINDSASPETYSLVFAAPTGWGVLGAPTSIALQPDEEATLFVTATIPPGAVAGDYDLEMSATSQSDPLDRGTAVASVSVTPMSEIEMLAPTGASIAPGDSITYQFVLVNRGNVQDSFAIMASSSRGLSVSLSHIAVNLAPRERVTFAVHLQVSSDAESGRDVLTVVAESTLFSGVEADAIVFTSVLPPAPDAIGGTVMEELPARIRLSIDKNVMTGIFDSQLTFSTSSQILGGYFSSFFSLLDPFGPSLAKISSFSMLYRRDPSTFSIGSVSQRLTDLVRLSCTGGSLKVDAEYYDLYVIGGGSNDETRFAGYFALGPDEANAGIGYMGIRDAVSISKSIWTATAHAEPLEDWTMTLEGSLGLDGQLTSRAVFFNTSINSSGYFFSGSAFSVGTNFPGQRADSAGIEVSQRLRLSALSLSASLSHEWDNVMRDPLQPTRIQDDLGFNLTATPLEDGPTLASTIDFSWDRYGDLSLKSDLTSLLSVSLTETSGVFPYSLSGKVLEQIDNVLGSHVQSTTYSEGVGLAIDEFNLFFQLTQKQSIDLITDTALSSSSDLSIRFRPETALHEASITFRNTRDDFDLSGSFFIHFTDNLDITFDGSISWDRHDADAISFGWGIAFNANVTIPLPFLVTKGRIEGR